MQLLRAVVKLTLRVAVKLLADVPNQPVAAKLPPVVVPPSKPVAAKHRLADALLNQPVAAKLRLAVALLNPLVAVKLLADVPLNRHVDAKHPRVVVARKRAVCSLTCSESTRALAANRLVVVKLPLAANQHLHVVAKLPLLADATAVATAVAIRLVAATRSAADC